MPETAFSALQILIDLISRTPSCIRYNNHSYFTQEKTVSYPRSPGWSQGRNLNSAILNAPNPYTIQRGRKENRGGFLEVAALQQNPSGFFQTPGQWRWALHVWGYCRWEVQYWEGRAVVRSNRWQPEIKGQRHSRVQLMAWQRIEKHRKPRVLLCRVKWSYSLSVALMKSPR